MSSGFSLQSSTIYVDGAFVRYDEAKIGLLTHGLHYGTGCFEGIRGYWSDKDQELYMLHLREHYERLNVSARMLFMKLPFDIDTLVAATIELCRRNAFKQGIYLRPFVFKSAEEIGVRLHDIPDRFVILAVPFTRYLEYDGGLSVCTSGWRRIDDTMIPARAKITGAYINSALAKSEAILSGFDEAIMLSTDGHVAEGSAENIFVIRKGVLYTPDPSQNILEGITRRSIMQIAREQLGLTVVERAIDRTELLSADELFFTGTAIGVVPISKVDHRQIGSGQYPITHKLLETYTKTVTDPTGPYAAWLSKVYAG